MQFFEKYLEIRATVPPQQACAFGGSALKVHKACREHVEELFYGKIPARRFSLSDFVSFFLVTYAQNPRKGMPSLTIDIESNPEAKKELSSLGLCALLNLYFSLERSKRVLWADQPSLTSLPKASDPVGDLEREKKHFARIKQELERLHSIFGTRGVVAEEKLLRERVPLKKNPCALLDVSIEKFLNLSDSFARWTMSSYQTGSDVFPVQGLCTMLEELTRWHFYLRSLLLLFQQRHFQLAESQKNLERTFWTPCARNLEIGLTQEISNLFEQTVFEAEMFPCLRSKYAVFYSPAGVKLNAKIVAQKTLSKELYMALQKMSRHRDLCGLWFKNKDFNDTREAKNEIQKLEVQQNPYHEMLDIALVTQSLKNSCGVDFLGSYLFLSFHFPPSTALGEKEPVICQFFCGWGVLCHKHEAFILCSSFTSAFCWWLAYLQKFNPALVLSLKRSNYVRNVIGALSPLVESPILPQ